MIRRLPPERLRRTIRQALLRRGLSAEHAGCVADGLVGTSLRGIDTHGIRLLPTYLAELDGGRARADPELLWQGEKAVRRLDAGGALGMVAGTVACREAVRLAGEHGVGAVSVANSNHFGAASVYTLDMARQGALGLAFTNGDALVAPFGGRHPLFGTNPLSLAVTVTHANPKPVTHPDPDAFHRPPQLQPHLRDRDGERGVHRRHRQRLSALHQRPRQQQRAG